MRVKFIKVRAIRPEAESEEESFYSIYVNTSRIISMIDGTDGVHIWVQGIKNPIISTMTMEEILNAAADA